MKDFFKEDHLRDELRKRRIECHTYNKALKKKMSIELFTDALSYVNETLGVDIDVEDMKKALVSDTKAYALLVTDGIVKSETRLAIKSAVSNYVSKAFGQ